MSPLATPLLMMSALRSGRYRLPIAPTSSRTSAIASGRRVRAQVGPQQADHAVLRPARRWLGRSRRALATRAHAARRGTVELLVGQPVEQASRGARDGRAPMSRKTARPASVGWTRTTRRSVSRLAALDEAALLHPVDDAGRARDRDVERVGEPPHRQRAVGLEDVRTWRWTRLSEPRSQVRNAPHALARLPASSRRASSLGDALAARASPVGTFNVTLTIYVTCSCRRQARRASAAARLRRARAGPA